MVTYYAKVSKWSQKLTGNFAKGRRSQELRLIRNYWLFEKDPIF
ncbi:hypothetical protein LEP1GSC125_2924 [Leptospira mayottensis 200901122]|uniref:Uncharacterized protein n=1 Tax=Leptospira mayottensis 200901122 TaxID=1193010 RepID=A0AA87SWN8_9LEPT|nr:hypothetical protein LEP1GSC125_2924 [Leptospira mayottensis 200901122]